MVLDVSIATIKFFFCVLYHCIGCLMVRPNEKLFYQNIDILYIFVILSLS